MASSQEPKPKPSVATSFRERKSKPSVVATNPATQPEKKSAKIWQNGSSPEAKAKSFVTPQIRKKIGSPDPSLTPPPAPKRARKTTSVLDDLEDTSPIPWPLQVRQQQTADPVMLAREDMMDDFVFGRIAVAGQGATTESMASAASAVISENDSIPSSASDEWSEQHPDS